VETSHAQRQGRGLLPGLRIVTIVSTISTNNVASSAGEYRPRRDSFLLELSADSRATHCRYHERQAAPAD
jgi:hypothetical protein